jgi:hypothetical protein
MTMPWQLREGLRRRPKGSPPRPLAEQLPSININNLKISKNLYTTVTAPWISLRYPFISNARLSAYVVEFAHTRGHIQSFKLKAIRTGFGIRFAFICNCGRPVIALYYRYGNLSCRHCCSAVYASQTCSKHQRSILQAIRIESFLNNKPRLLRRTRERLTKKLGQKVMMAQRSMGTRARSLRE